MNFGRILRNALSACVVALALGSLPAHAVVISSGTNNPLNFSWSYGTAAGDLTGFGSMVISGFNSSSLLLSISLTNTSALSTNRLTAFGFGIDPNASGVTFIDVSDGGIVAAAAPQNTNLGSGIIIDVCAWSGANCQGGGSGGIFGAGGSDSFALLLGGNWGSSVNIDPLALKYQTGAGSFEFCVGPSSCTPTTRVPEPGSIALFGIGLLSLCLGLRRRRA